MSIDTNDPEIQRLIQKWREQINFQGPIGDLVSLGVPPKQEDNACIIKSFMDDGLWGESPLSSVYNTWNTISALPSPEVALDDLMDAAREGEQIRKEYEDGIKDTLSAVKRNFEKSQMNDEQRLDHIRREVYKTKTFPVNAWGRSDMEFMLELLDKATKQKEEAEQIISDLRQDTTAYQTGCLEMLLRCINELQNIQNGYLQYGVDGMKNLRWIESQSFRDLRNWLTSYYEQMRKEQGLSREEKV